MFRIVVGVDGSANAQLALAWAVEEARARRGEVRAVFVSPKEYVPEHVAVKAGGAAGLSDEERTTHGHSLLKDAIRAVDGGDVPIEPVVALDRHPAEVLVEESDKADLLVVGSRGLGEFAGMLIGSVSQHCLTRTRCPLVVVPSGD